MSLEKYVVIYGCIDVFGGEFFDVDVLGSEDVGDLEKDVWVVLIDEGEIG